jgi:hypothetical protein
MPRTLDLLRQWAPWPTAVTAVVVTTAESALNLLYVGCCVSLVAELHLDSCASLALYLATTAVVLLCICFMRGAVYLLWLSSA